MATTEAPAVATSSVIVTNPERRGGLPCFVGTRVDVKTFFDYLEGGYSIDGFLEQYPSIARDQILALLAECLEAAERSARRIDT